MHFEKGGIYHIYNQGNNKQKIFFSRDNYMFFLKKISVHVLPYADILSWCLMPNHFHLMVYVRETGMLATPVAKNNKEATFSLSATPIQTPTIKTRSISLNHSIGIILASYTRAIHKQENRTGSLFRQETKSICLNEIKRGLKDWVVSEGITYFTVDTPESQYAQICFNYIHNNPVNAHLTKTPGEWEFSSYLDIAGIRDGKLVNRERIQELGLKVSDSLGVG